MVEDSSSSSREVSRKQTRGTVGKEEGALGGATVCENACKGSCMWRQLVKARARVKTKILFIIFIGR